MSYQVKEIYFTMQGEGGQAGRPAVFCRFAGCNLWSGREADRAGARCWFCDTDFVGTDGARGGLYRSAEQLAAVIASAFPTNGGYEKRCVVFTGGEPLLQLDEPLIAAMKALEFDVAVETNGTIEAPAGIDWITVSPKPNSELVQRRGTELKLVFPDVLPPQSFSSLDFEYFFLSPRWSPDESELKLRIAAAVDYCRLHPQWRLTLQYHKIWGIP